MQPILAFGMPSGGELIFIFAIILLIFGGKKLPELARALGQAKKEFTKASIEVNHEIEKMKEMPTSEDEKKNGSKKS